MAETRLACAALCALLATTGASAEPRLPDTYLSRVEALASMEALNATILASRSATRALESWCADHRLAAPAKVFAERVRGSEKAAGPDQRAHLAVGPDEPVKYRRVLLVCGKHVLSEADNWYVPSRLTPEMNRLLETTDTPFGKVVAGLGFTRETMGVEVLWAPLPPGWELQAAPLDHPDRALDVPPVLFEHRAILYDKAHRPFSEVDEHYLRDALTFRAAAPTR
jgi:chorismate-pyruvate lyase